MPVAPTQSSRISAILQGRRGPRLYDFALYRTNQLGDRLSRVAAVHGASVNLSNQRENSWEISMPLGEASRINVIEDYVEVVIYLYDGGTEEWHEFPFGHYYFDAPAGEDTVLSTEYQLAGKSLESVLMDSSAHLGFAVQAGVGVLSMARQLILQRGFAGSQINFPSTSADKVLPVDFFADPFQDADSVRWLRIINSLFTAGGFYALYTDAEGRFTTKSLPIGQRPTVEVAYGNSEAAPTRIATRGGGVQEWVRAFEDMVIGPSPWQVDDENFANSVVVMSADADQQFVIARAENFDPNSRVSIPALKAAGRGDGRVQREPFVADILITQQEAQMVADQILRTESGMNEQRQITTALDPRRAPHETYELGLVKEDGTELATGVWPCIGWSVDLDVTNMQMTHDLIRGIEV